MEPTLGRIVHYTLTQVDVDAIKAQRSVRIPPRSDDVRPCVGNDVSEGDVVPMMVTQVWTAECVNGQCFLDGNDQHWRTSATYSESYPPEPGSWTWPPRV